MFHHPSDSRSLTLFKQIFFWVSLVAMFLIFIILFNDDLQIAQKELSIDLEIKDQVNICRPNNFNDSESFKKKEESSIVEF
jgi:hypothetical protein